MAKTIAACLNKKQKKKTDKKNSDKNSGGADCHDERRYERVKAATGPADYNLENGWTVSSFQTNGFE